MDKTLLLRSYSDIPAGIRGDCMQRLSVGVYRHVRLGVVLVIHDEILASDNVLDAIALVAG